VICWCVGMVDWISFGVVWLVRSINRIDGSRVFCCRRWLRRRERVRGSHLQNDHKICDCALGYLKNSCNDLRGNDPPTEQRIMQEIALLFLWGST
jgi:hypothetical protein